MMENDKGLESVSPQSVEQMGMPRWVYFMAMFIVVLVMFILLLQHDFNGAIIALFASVVLIYTVQNQQIEYLTKRLDELVLRSKNL
jgi:cell division protein FtsW (lipid II flippase)